MTTSRTMTGAAILGLALIASPPAPGAREQADAGRLAWGTLKGRVVFEGEPPKVVFADFRDVKDGPFLARSRSPIVLSTPRVDPATKGVRDALVFLRDPTAVSEQSRQAASRPVAFQAILATFEPHILPVQSGTAIEVGTLDPIGYNVRFNLRGVRALVRRHEAPDIAGRSHNLILNEGPFSVVPEGKSPAPEDVCDDIHPWNRAYWMVFDHPYFAVTDARGEFAIGDVPLGEQRVVVWHERVGWVTPKDGQPVAIAPDRPAEFRAAITADRIRR